MSKPKPLTADELEALRVQCVAARRYFEPDARDPGDDEAREAVAFYRQVLRLIAHYRHPGGAS
jgi:hypothetical protein